MITKKIIPTTGGFYYTSPLPLVADDVQAYEVVLNTTYDLTGVTVRATTTRADGAKIDDVGTVEGNTAKYILKNNMYSKVGTTILRLTLISEDGSVLTTKELSFEVVEGNGDADLSGDDRLPVLTQLIVDTGAAKADANAAANYANEQGAYAEQQGETASLAVDTHKTDAVLDHPDGSVTEEKLSAELAGKVNSLSYATRSATIKIAASNATEKSKAAADYVCDGAGDQAVINAAITEIAGTGGCIELSEGTFNCTFPIYLRDITNITLRGQGEATLINYTGASGGDQSAISVSRSVSSVKIENLSVNSTACGIGEFASSSPVLHVHNCKIIAEEDAILHVGSSQMTVDRCLSQTTASTGFADIFTNSELLKVISSNLPNGGLWNAGSRCVFIGNKANKILVEGGAILPSTPSMLAELNDVPLENITIS